MRDPSSTIKVLFVIASAQIGGAEKVILSLIQGLPRDQVEPYVVCPPGGPMVDRYRRVAAGVITVAHRNFMSVSAILEIAALIRRWDIDLVHTCLYTSDVAGIVASRIARTPRVVSHVVGHNFFVTDERGLRRVCKQALSFLYRGVYAWSDRVIAVSEALKDDLASRRGLRVSPSKIVVIRHTVRPEELTPTADDRTRARVLCGVSGESAVIAMVATFDPIKGHRHLVQAMGRIKRLLPQVTCVLVGDGPCRRPLETLANRMGLTGHLVFTGLLEDGVKNAIMELSRVIVLPSLTEGLPLVLLEAMALGKPVVASDTIGVRELVTDRVTGFLVRPGDPAALAEAIVGLVPHQDLVDAMGRAGRQRLEATLSAQDAAARMAIFYRTLVEGDGAIHEPTPRGEALVTAAR